MRQHAGKLVIAGCVGVAIGWFGHGMLGDDREQRVPANQNPARVASSNPSVTGTSGDKDDLPNSQAPKAACASRYSRGSPYTGQSADWLNDRGCRGFAEPTWTKLRTGEVNG